MQGYHKLGMQLRLKRVESGLHQKTLGILLGGATQALISWWKSGRYMPGPRYRRNLRDGDGVDKVNYLFSYLPKIWEIVEVEAPNCRAISAKGIPKSCTSFRAKSERTLEIFPRRLPIRNSGKDTPSCLQAASISS